MFRFLCFRVEASKGTMSTHYPDSADHSARGSAGRRDKAGRDVVCKICQAVYVPAHTHRQLARSPRAVIESVFMSMCHFCFRCRQPACPSCWDDVHGVCGACALEAHLPFRSSVPPLDGTVTPSVQQLPSVRVRTVTPPLVCVRPGRFQRAPLPIEAQTTLYVPTVSNQPPDAASKGPSSQKMSHPSDSVGTGLAPVRGQEQALSLRRIVVENIADIVTRPEKKRV